MKLRILLTIHAAVTALFGIAFLFVPGQVVSTYGAQEAPALNYLGQLSGSSLVSVAVLTWAARSAAESDARRAIVLSLFALYGIGFILSLSAVLRSVIGPLGWSSVALNLLFTVGFGYFQFRKSTS
jgi:uncharacterized membrane protein